MYCKTTSFDLFLPRVLAGDRISHRDIAACGHGGFCIDCDECRYPDVPKDTQALKKGQVVEIII
ncbi:hypothetical protein [Wukongibacter sp. M2B1]|uniref:hypothetical protein n=1 Tax=Wukongibacter sp. M2B1 TaxID=3088895 RepID=UPI003D7AAFB2